MFGVYERPKRESFVKEFPEIFLAREITMVGLYLEIGQSG
jgi:hypothetical protein